MFQGPKLISSLKPWVILIGVFLLLKVTGLSNEISDVTRGLLLKTGLVDARPESDASKQTFDYNFTVTDLQGNTLDMRDLKGKIIFINLWATWCGPCRVEMPSIQNLYNSVDKDRIAFVMLSLDKPDQQARVARFISRQKFTFPVYLPAGDLPKLLRVRTIPATFVIDAEGNVVHKVEGMANYDTDEFRAVLDRL